VSNLDGCEPLPALARLLEIVAFLFETLDDLRGRIEEITFPADCHPSFRPEHDEILKLTAGLLDFVPVMASRVTVGDGTVVERMMREVLVRILQPDTFISLARSRDVDAILG
jgi:hypothetical protein